MPWFEMGDNDRFWYEDQGSGPVLILLHGWCMSSAVWRFQFETLSAAYRIIAPDLRGHGRTSASGDDYGFELLGADIIALLRHLDIQDALLAGWSLGGQVAMQAAGHLGARLSGLVLISSTPRFTAAEDFPWGLSPLEAQGMTAKLRRNAVRALEGFMSRMFAPGELDDPAVASSVREVIDGVLLPVADVALQNLHALVEADMRPLLPAINLPTLIINGDRDVICLPGASDYLARQIPFGEHVVMPGCGHAPFLTRSREFADCLIHFSRRVCDSNQ